MRKIAYHLRFNNRKDTMGWATHAIEELKQGRSTTVRPVGQSMAGRVESGTLCHLEPVSAQNIPKRGDVVLVKVGRNQYLHLVSAVNGNRYQISNNHGHVNGWVGIGAIYGILREA